MFKHYYDGVNYGCELVANAVDKSKSRIAFGNPEIL